MTLFWIICALLLAVALLFVVLPLWHSKAKSNQVLRDAANLEIFRDQIAEMDADLANGLLTPELYEQGKRELQARLLEEVKTTGEGANLLVRNPPRTLAVVLVFLLPLASIGLYWKLGNQNAFLPQSTYTAAEGFGAVLSDVGLKALEEKLAKKPQDPESWLLLARSYAELERYADAVKAYDKLTQLVPNEAQLWADYADAMAMANGQKFAGTPALLLNKALEIDPNNEKALALAGSAAMERGDFATGIRYWESLLKQIPEGSEGAKMVAGGIQQAREALARSNGGKSAVEQGTPAAEKNKPASAGKERITGTVTLSAALAGKAGPNDTLFVLARAADGPKVPLAVVRRQVKDLPLQFSLDDSMAMSPQMKLSNYDKVVLIARVSRSGDATQQPGDLLGVSAILKPGSSGVKLSIDNIVK